MPDGFFFDEGVLTSVAEKMLSASSSVRDAISAEVGNVDAGVTSDAVAAALARVLVASDAAAETLTQVGYSVNASKGSYAHIENTNEGVVRMSDRGRFDFPQAEPGPLLNAPDRNPTLPPQGRR